MIGKHDAARTAWRREARQGFTIIELMIVVLVICILAALLIPAVQSARESARRVYCLNNLKQIGLAMHGYAESWTTFPTNRGYLIYSPLAAILPFADRGNLYDSMNFNLGLSSWEANGTCLSTHVSLFLCPSDPMSTGNSRSTSYACNVGDGYYWGGHFNGLFAPQGILNNNITIKWNDILDGTTTTAMISEWLLGRNDQRETPSRSFYTEAVPSTDHLDFVTRCRSTSEVTRNYGYSRGRSWTAGSWADSLYDHALPLNSPGCLRYIRDKLPTTGLIGSCSAGSVHRDGAHTAFADGHVGFVRESISLAVWRAIGSRNGGELVPADSY